MTPVERLRVLARVVPGAAFEERVIDRDYEATWSFVADLETSVPQFEQSVDRLVRRDGADGIAIKVWSRLGPVRIPLAMDVELRDGLCIMQARHYVVGMAAVPEGDRTRFALLEAARLPRWASAAATVVGLVRRSHVHRDLASLARCLERR